MKRSGFFSLKKGGATGIAMGFSTGIILISAGATTFVMNTLEENQDLEGSVVSYYAAERGLEYALFDVSGHLPGYEVETESDETADYGKLKTQDRSAKTQIEIKSRTSSDNTGDVTFPAEDSGSFTEDDDWNTLEQGKVITIPLYIDNTGK